MMPQLMAAMINQAFIQLFPSVINGDTELCTISEQLSRDR